MKKRDFLLIAGILVIACVAFLLRGVFSGEHHQIRITVDGEIYGTYSLDEDQTIRINDTNTCRIENGTARMIQADCPDHLCMKQNPVDKNGGTITCLPNRVVIEAVGGKDDVDIMVSAIW